MAKLSVNGIEGVEDQLARIGGRESARRIVEAGAKACAAELEKRTDEYRHVVTGSMMSSFAPGKYHEDIDVCWQDVYPQGTDSRGISNTKKAFIINYGRGGKRTQKTGDKFITGKKTTLEQVVGQAMKAEAEQILKEAR